MLFLPKTAASHEDLFVERYQRLFSWSLRLTDNDRSQAEDLVHDAFILFTLNQPDLASINNLDAYLHTTLRNLHLSQIRSATRSRFQQLSILDYDSAELGLRGIDPRDQISAQDDLRRVCHYACARKETAKIGSVLILRYFHGYYPSEIVRLLRTTRNATDRALLLARGEAKAGLSNPRSFSFMAKNQIPEVLPTDFARTTQGFLSELRQRIFLSRQGECFSKEQLKRLYHSRKQTRLSCGQLAHIVSCPECLDEVNRILSLPLLADRYPTDTMNKDTSFKGGPKGGGPTGGAPSGSLKKWKREAKAAFEHKPQELCIAVNGYIQGSQKISADLMEQSFIIDMAEKIGFVEVFSEQGIRLLLLNIDEPPPNGPGEHSLRVGLSDQRALELSLRFSNPWPTIHVTYSDPAAKAEALAENETRNLEIDSATDADVKSQAVEFPKLNSLKHALTRAQHLFADLSFWLKPTTVTAILAVLLLSVALVTYFKRVPVAPISARDLLARSVTAEDALLARADQVLHRTLTLEENISVPGADRGPKTGSPAGVVDATRSASGPVVTQRKIEIWQSAEKGITARRLYDDRQNLIAGDWRRRDGVQTLYNHGSRPQIQLVPEKRDGYSSISFDEVWQLEPSAREFIALIGGIDRAQVTEEAASYVLSYSGGPNAGAATGLLRASLVLKKSDLHATEQILVLQKGNDVREFRLVETSFERHASSTVAPKIFEPEPELLRDTGKRGNGETENISASPRPPVTESPAAVATADLEVEVLSLLSQAGADMDEQTSVTRAADGKLRVSGLVEDRKRKEEILRALAPVSANPAVQVRIETVAEATQRLAQDKAQNERRGDVSVERIEISNSNIPAYADLRRHFGSDEEVARFASRMVNRSSQAMSHAAVLRRLVRQFSAEDLRTLKPEARAKWLGIIRAHALAFQSEIAGVRQELAPVFFSAGTLGGGERGNPSLDDVALVRAVEQLSALAASNDTVIRAAFTTSTGESSSSAIKSPQFWRSLNSAEALAGRIQTIR